MRVKVAAFEEALKVRTLKDFPIDYAGTQNNLGNAYQTLAEVKDKAENCQKAITAYEEAFKVYKEGEFPGLHQLVESDFRIAIPFAYHSLTLVPLFSFSLGLFLLVFHLQLAGLSTLCAATQDNHGLV